MNEQVSPIPAVIETTTTTSTPENNKKPGRFSLAIILVIILTILLLLSFHVGTIIGFRKASFSCAWNKNYAPLFGGSAPHGVWRPSMMKRLPDPHGAFGRVMRIDNRNIIIKDQNGIEKNILVPQSSATIRRGMNTVPFEDIHAQDMVSVFGQPDAEGHVEADLIRIISPK
ncbi:hypothetical protein IT408_02730 [Candidatus Uhrbacteria bacterium]|nr:hypothetical protein [Candidatus Uhrbacteria bacterium]